MINTGDTAFMMICAALVFIMTPGLAFFYGGLVSRKNVLTIMMQSFISMGVVTILSGLSSGPLAYIWSGCTRVGRRIEIHVPSRSRHGSQSGLRKHDPIYVLLSVISKCLRS